MSDAHDTIVTQLNERKIKAITDDDYIIADMGVDSGYQYNVFTFDSLTVDRVLTLPTLADNQGYVFEIVNLDGSYDVEITPEGAELINDWNLKFSITEKYGRVQVIALSDRWLVTPLGDACIYEVSSASDITLANNTDYQDVTGISLTLDEGLYDLSIKCQRLRCGYSVSTVNEIYVIWGFGITSGNNAPDIYWWQDYINTGSDIINLRHIPIDNKYEDYYNNSSSQTIYIKSQVYTEEGINLNDWQGDAAVPIIFKAIRRY